MSSKPNANIVQLNIDQLPEAADVLTAAFIEDPFMKFLFGEDIDVRRKSTRSLMYMGCKMRLTLGELVLGAEVEGRIGAVSGVALPGEREWPESLGADWEQLMEIIGPEAAARFQGYLEMSERNSNPDPHYYVMVLGVHPDFQGHGLGGQLVEHIIALSENDPLATGIGLDTENPVNLSFYRKYGFEIRATDAVDDLDVTIFFRPNQNGAA